MFLNKKEAKLSISWLTRACNQHLSSSSTGPIVAILIVKICDETRCLSFRILIPHWLWVWKIER